MEWNCDLSQRMLSHIPVGVFVLDAQGNYLYVNEEYCHSVNKSPEFFEGMSIPKLKKLGYLTTSVWEQVMETCQSVISVISITDERMNRAYDTLTVGIPLFGPRGEVQYIVFRQESLEKLNERLQAGMLNKHMFHSGQRVQSPPEDDVIAESPQMKQILNTLSLVSKTDAAILVTGPSGSGKEVLAKRIHRSSVRSGGPLVALNCAAIPENLLESELFGYEKGAFTGASSQGKKGLIEAADGGTLFLDEINSMPLVTQAKLLRVLETKQVTRLGATGSRTIDFRLVCSSNEDLNALVEQRLFRSDLFYRINVISVSIPPLRERKEDIAPLAIHFMEHFCKKYGYVKALSEAALKRLTAYSWPGNVRELRNVIERTVITSGGAGWELTDIPLEQFDRRALPAQGTIPPAAPEFIYHDDFSLKDYMEQCEKRVLTDLLDRGQSPRQMAGTLKIDLSNVYRKLQKYHLTV